MIFFFKSDGTLIKSAPETVYQGSAEAGKVYVVAPLNANMLVDVYYELPNGERWGAYLLENNGTVINNEELPDGWALWSTTLESAITQYAGTLKAQFGFYQSGTADKVPLITSQGVTITIAKGVVRDVFPDSPNPEVYDYLTSTISTIKQNFNNLPNEYLGNTQEDKIALKNNTAIEYSENATAGTIAKRDSNGKLNVEDGTEDLNAVNLGQLNAALNDLDNVYVRRYKAPVIIERRAYVVNPSGYDETVPIHTTALGDDLPIRTSTGQLKAADGVEDDDLATVKQLNAVQGNYTDITNIDLNTGDTTVEYDTELGITVNAKGTITHKNGNAEQPTTKYELPIVAGDGIVIDKAQNEEKISVKVDGKVTKTPNSIVKRDSAGRVKTADAVSDEDAASYGQQKALRNYADSELLKKLDRTGGTITGNLIVSGNLSVSGEASVIESTTLKVADKLIYVAKDNISALTSPAGLITPKYDGTNDGGLVYDNSGTAYVGDIKLDSNGNVDVNTSGLQPIATRDAYSNFTNGHKVKAEVDPSQKSVKFVDGGKDDGINSLTGVNLTIGNTTVQYDTTNGIQINSTARFTDATGNHDATMELDLPVAGINGIAIGKAVDSEKVEIGLDDVQKIQYVELAKFQTLTQEQLNILKANKSNQILYSDGDVVYYFRLATDLLNGYYLYESFRDSTITLTVNLTTGKTIFNKTGGGVTTITKGTGQFAEIFNYNPTYPSHSSASYAHAEGLETYALEHYTHTEGCRTYATNVSSHAEGQYNINPMPENLIHATGIGVSDSDRRDGFEVYKTGEVWCKGPLYVGGDGYTLDKTTSKEVATKEYVDSQVGGGGSSGGGKLYRHDVKITNIVEGSAEYFKMSFLSTSGSETTDINQIVDQDGFKQIVDILGYIQIVKFSGAPVCFPLSLAFGYFGGVIYSEDAASLYKTYYQSISVSNAGTPGTPANITHTDTVTEI